MPNNLPNLNHNRADRSEFTAQYYGYGRTAADKPYTPGACYGYKPASQSLAKPLLAAVATLACFISIGLLLAF